MGVLGLSFKGIHKGPGHGGPVGFLETGIYRAPRDPLKGSIGVLRCPLKAPPLLWVWGFGVFCFFCLFCFFCWGGEFWIWGLGFRMFEGLGCLGL